MAGKIFEGVVTSAKMQKTLVVSVNRKYREGRTGKIVSTRKKFKVHCEDSNVKSGDRISFEQCRPLSRDKRFRLLEVLQRSEVAATTTLDETQSSGS